MQNIGQDTVKNCLVGFPPIEEQNKISQYLDQHESEIERTEQITERAIVKLEEHRAALIAAAVTGKIDVRTHSTDTVEAAD